MDWHNLDIEKTLTLTESSPQGLPAEEVKRRLAKFGYNRLAETKRATPWQLFFKQFSDFMILILLIAAVISGFAGDYIDTIVILSIILINAIVGFIQEYRAGKAMDAIKKMVTQQTVVMRSNQAMTIDADELVIGDIVCLEAGNVVPADLRLIDEQGLKVMEAALTGESVPADKTIKALPGTLSIGDRLNMSYKGTQVSAGKGKGVVVATGMNTEIGQIAKMLQQEEAPTPLQLRMTDFGKKLSVLIIAICVILLVVGLLRGEAPLNMLLVAISLAVAAIPEALPALITIGLSKGAKQLVTQNVLVRKLTAVEALGSVTTICTDKTGTLTQNKMTVVDLRPAAADYRPSGQLSLLQLAMCLNNDAQQDSVKWIGDPTEVAMAEFVQERYRDNVCNRVRQQFVRVGEIPFDSERKCMTTVHRFEERFLAISKGATEVIVRDLKPGEPVERILADADRMASAGIRVLAFACKWLDNLPDFSDHASIETELFFVGLVGMTDPPRNEVKAAIAECKTAGIRPVMITGDHKQTAASIARQIGLLSGAEIVVTGHELSMLSAAELDERVEKIAVYARVSPQQKLDIIKSLQRKNHFVSMTGDGVNDAPSLQRANIGIAMGVTGTDVTKEAAGMILLDDNFATIVKAVKEGRRIYDNIRRFVKYILTCNSAEIWTLFLAPLLGLPIPLLPIQILWINLVTDGFPALALSAEKAEDNIMRRPPRRPGESLFADGVGVHIIWVGLFMAFITLSVQAWAFDQAKDSWQTMVFTVLSVLQLAHVLAVRSDYEFIYRKGFLTNPFLLVTVITTFLLQLGVVYLPWANTIFKTVPLSLTQLLICLSAGVILFHMVELEKWLRTKLRKKKISP